MDGISAGVSIAFAMECYENGIIGKEDTDGIELTWGNADTMIASKSHRSPVARALAIFWRMASNGPRLEWARCGEICAACQKGPGIAHARATRQNQSDPGLRGLPPTGADHMEAIHDPSFEGLGTMDNGLSEAGLIEPVDRMDMGPKKVHAFFYAQAIWSLYNCIGMCDFVGIPIGALKLHALQDYINAATGWDMTVWELLKVGERANTMSRLYNLPAKAFTRQIRCRSACSSRCAMASWPASPLTAQFASPSSCTIRWRAG